MTQSADDNIFKSMKDIQLENTISHRVRNDDERQRRKPRHRRDHGAKARHQVTYMPAMIRIDGKGKIVFKMSEISEALGREMTPYLFEIVYIHPLRPHGHGR